MCHSFLFSLLFGILLARVLFRWRYGGCGAWRQGGGACGGAGFGGLRGGRGFGRWARRGFPGGPFGGGGAFPEAFQGGARPIETILQGLELNQRQQEEAAPVLNLLTEAVGRAGARVEFALAAVAAESFERGRLEGLLVDAPTELRRELIDGLEHVHNILIPEQRAHLLKQLGREEKKAPAQS